MPIVTFYVPAGTKVETIETPDGKPPAGDTAALAAMTQNRDAWMTVAKSLRDKWQAEADKDKAEEVGKDALAIQLPPVV